MILLAKGSLLFFFAGGVSAYIMTKEKNQYNVTMNGTPGKSSREFIRRIITGCLQLLILVWDMSIIFTNLLIYELNLF